LLAGIRPVGQYFTNGHVASMASALLAASLGILSMLSLGIGLILNSINLRLLEVEKLLILRPGERITPADKG